MKKVLITGFIVAISLLIIPLGSLSVEEKTVQTLAKNAVAQKTVSEDTKEKNDITFRIKTENEIKELSAREYICGVLAAEMPASFNIEALKAQSVAAFTFALYKKEEKSYDEYDLTDNFKTDQSYISEEKQKEKWGDGFEEKSKKISEAVESTLGTYLSYNGKPALALYCSLSSGKTNSCADVFGGEIPYLVSVDSEGDKLCPDYKSVFSFSIDELKAKLSSINAGPEGDNFFKNIKTANSGLVKALDYGGKSTTGGKISGLLGLPSSAFTVELSDGAYTFTCFGRGHGVGMSQYGAEFMAKSGADYKEILLHYYPGTEIKKL